MSISNTSGLLGALQGGSLGVSRGLEGLARDAQTVAHAAVEPDKTADVTAALVDSLGQKHLVQASARVLSAADRTLGTLLDTKA